METHSISAGLDYPVRNHCVPLVDYLLHFGFLGCRSGARLVEGLGSCGIHCRYRRGSSARIPNLDSEGRNYSRYVLNHSLTSRTELTALIFLALESAHAVWGTIQLAKTLPKEANIVMVSFQVSPSN